jgi:hypothetical protein
MLRNATDVHVGTQYSSETVKQINSKKVQVSYATRIIISGTSLNQPLWENNINQIVGCFIPMCYGR